MTPQLSERGFVVVERLLDPSMAEILYQVFVLRQWRGEVKQDNQVPEAGSHWGDTTLDATLVALRPRLEEVTGMSLLPTYSYGRLYPHGVDLAPHRDRAEAEVAATVHLGHRGQAPPPICFHPDHRVVQRPGDAVVYLGSRLLHWRATFEGERFGQLFLNYVRADGPQRHRVFDGRVSAYPPELRPPAEDGESTL